MAKFNLYSDEFRAQTWNLINEFEIKKLGYDYDCEWQERCGEERCEEERSGVINIICSDGISAHVQTEAVVKLSVVTYKL